MNHGSRQKDLAVPRVQAQAILGPAKHRCGAWLDLSFGPFHQASPAPSLWIRLPISLPHACPRGRVGTGARTRETTGRHSIRLWEPVDRRHAILRPSAGKASAGGVMDIGAGRPAGDGNISSQALERWTQTMATWDRTPSKKRIDQPTHRELDRV